MSELKLGGCPSCGKSSCVALECTRQRCAVNGLVRPGAMCGSVIVGGKFCGFAGQCPHQLPPTKGDAA